MISGLSSSSHFPVLFGEFFLISPHISLIAALSLATRVSANAVAQSIYGDQACGQYADQKTGGLRAQAGSQTSAARCWVPVSVRQSGAPPGCGRGAGIVAASGANLGPALGRQCAEHRRPCATAMHAFYNQCYNQCMRAHQSTSSYRHSIARSGEYAPPSGYGPEPRPDRLGPEPEATDPVLFVAAGLSVGRPAVFPVPPLSRAGSAYRDASASLLGLHLVTARLPVAARRFRRRRARANWTTPRCCRRPEPARASTAPSCRRS